VPLTANRPSRIVASEEKGLLKILFPQECHCLPRIFMLSYLH